MKRLLLSLIALVSCLSLFTQDAMLIYRHNYPKPLFVALKDVTTISHSDTAQVLSLEEWNIQAQSLASDIDSIVFIESDTINISDYAYFTCPDDHHPHMIDLGLPSGVLWSCCNVDATTPEEYGGYYAWGETEEKDYYHGSNYKYSNGDKWSCHYIGDDIAGTEYDVAHVKWGDSWEMPSLDMINELLDYCKIDWIKKNGVEGFLVTGTDGATVFFPAAGYGYGSIVGQGWAATYWSSTLNYDFDPYTKGYAAYSLSGNANENTVVLYTGDRCWGHNIRPIINPKGKSNNNSLCPDNQHPHMIDLGLPSGTLWSCCNVDADSPEEYGGYYSWGETETKECYDWSTYVHYNDSAGTFSSIREIENTQYDVAHVKWGESWHLPSKDQFTELIDNCTRRWVILNHVIGSLVTGPNGRKIFLPAAGDCVDNQIGNRGQSAFYWSSSLNPNDENRAYGLQFFSNVWGVDYMWRIYGLSVRPVSNDGGVLVAGIPSDNDAIPNPIVTAEDLNTVIPNFSYTISKENNWAVVRLDMTGVRDPYTKDWLRLYGTGSDKQNVWLSLDEKPKGFSIHNTIDDAGDQKIPMVDLVFLVDNSTSMSEEADAIYRDIIDWSQQLSRTLDIRFGCVGYGGFVSGAINLTTADVLKNYLETKSWTSSVDGIWRTRGFAGKDSLALYEASLEADRRVVSSGYRYTQKEDPNDNECGVMALRYANDLFSFRNGANRVYVNLTDEPNQPGNKYNLFSTQWVKENWTTTQGTIHTVYTQDSSWEERYKNYIDENYPWDLSIYTDGTMLFTNSYFKDVNGNQVHLSDLPVSGALQNSYIIRFTNVQDIFDGMTHNLHITVKSSSENGEIIADREYSIIFEE